MGDVMGTVAECARCGVRRRLVARRLCSSCYGQAHGARALDEYPLVGPTPGEPLVLWCICTEPKPVRIPWFNCDQCATCGRGFKPAVLL